MSGFNWNDHPIIDPNKPNQGQSQGFNWDDHPVVEKPNIQASKAESALQGFGQAGTLGYLPNIQAAVEPYTDKLFSAITGKDIGDQKYDYIKSRDANIKRDVALKEANPGSYTGGQIAGSIATPTPGAGLIKGTGAIAKLARAGVGAGVVGALYNPGEKEGELSDLQLGERAKQSLVGAGTGLVAQGAAGALSKGLEAYAGKADKIQSTADALTLDAMGTKKKYANMLIDKGTSEDPLKHIKTVTEFARNNDIVKAGESFEDAYLKSNKVRGDLGKKIKTVYDQAIKETVDPKVLEKAAPGDILRFQESQIPPKNLAHQFLLQEADRLKGTSNGQQILGKIDNELKNLNDVGNDIPSLLKYRRSIDSTIKNWSREGSGGEESLKNLRNFIKDNIDQRIDALDKIVGSEKIGELKKLNKDYSLASDVNSILEDKYSRQIANRHLGLIPAIIGTGGAAVGAGSALAHGDDPGTVAKRGLLGAAGGYAFSKGRDYLPAIGAKALSGVAQVLERDPLAGYASQGAGLLNRIPPEKLGKTTELLRRR